MCSLSLSNKVDVSISRFSLAFELAMRCWRQIRICGKSDLAEVIFSVASSGMFISSIPKLKVWCFFFIALIRLFGGAGNGRSPSRAAIFLSCGVE